MELKRFKYFLTEDMLDEKEPEVERFGEYRKGSGEFGGLIDRMMTWLRNYKDDPKVTRIKTKTDKFLKESGIEYEELQKFIERKQETNLVTFNVEVIGDEVQFSGLNDSKKSRYVWEKNKE